ncbi:helix-turn-helix domain-containing protein [Rhizobium leguminosarum]|uniref:helix-turn-helix domain-containing protein n=1 Tax=Rhizobium leguminosarum TaxID=384 RepID=UPI001C949184|nr:helix-turn-helix domain-containing protein [Rhizobium leguminosarum]MBY5827763.1 helix-turn-helix domain-containing protein [Rhizobium leguminosarum]
MNQSNSRVLLRREANWSGVRAELVRRADLKRQEIDFHADGHSIFLNIQGAASHGESYLDGRRTGFVARPEGSLSYVPPDCTWSGWDVGDALASYLLISVEKSFAENLFGGLAGTERLGPEIGFKDLSIQFATRKIASELRQDDRVSGLMVEGHITTIFGHLFRRGRSARRLPTGGLAPRALRTAIDAMEASLDQKLTLSQLAGDIGVSVEHLCRAFKQSTGLSPHAYLNRRRLQRASDLLRGTSMSITEIAFTCGYSSASHLSSSFRLAIGVPPKEYRSTWCE